MEKTMMQTKRKGILSKYLLLIVLIIEIFIGWLINPNLLTPMNIQVILFACTLNGIISIGQSLVLIAKEIDLSVGANLVFAPIFAVNTANIITEATSGVEILQGKSGFLTGGWELVVLLTIIFAVAVGLANGLIVTKCKIPAFIATIGMQFLLKGLSYVVSNGIPIFIQDVEESKFIGNACIADVVPISVLVFIVIGLVMIMMCSKTKFGTRLYATGGGLKAAKLSGINTDRWKIIAYVMCGLMVGIAAIISMSRLQGVEITQATKGNYDMNSIAISIIGGIALSGGKGSIAGTMQATGIIAILLNILNMQGLMSYYQLFFTGCIIVVIAIIHQKNESRRLKALKIIEI